ncbi:TMED1 protein, partial [Amia calva]|nr:TMED1 protein [Amia calva]
IQVCLAIVSALCVGQTTPFIPAKDSEFTFILPAGRIECFFQTATKNSTMEVEYQVIAGAGMDVDFTINNPNGYQLISEFRKSDGVHTVEPTDEGDYQICFDNTFSKFSEKMVFFEVIFEGPGGDAGQDDWSQMTEPESLLEYKLEDIRESVESVHRRLERSMHFQNVLRAYEARDRILQDDNLWRVTFWSCLNMLVLLVVAMVQVYTLRSLFEDKKKVRT